MTLPHIYSHVVIDTQGNIVKRRYYKEINTNRPRLVVDPGLNVVVEGGEPYDPAVRAPSRPTGRSIKDRPPGL